jgi:hypothetical protein
MELPGLAGSQATLMHHAVFSDPGRREYASPRYPVTERAQPFCRSGLNLAVVNNHLCTGLVPARAGHIARGDQQSGIPLQSLDQEFRASLRPKKPPVGLLALDYSETIEFAIRPEKYLPTANRRGRHDWFLE